MKLAEQLEAIITNRLAQDNLTLPLLAPIAAKVNEVVRRSDATVKELTETVQMDPILAALIMKQAGQFGIKTLEQASNKLGPQRVRSVLAEACGRKVMESRDHKTLEAVRLIWEHARAVGLLAQFEVVSTEVPSLIPGGRTRSR